MNFKEWLNEVNLSQSSDHIELKSTGFDQLTYEFTIGDQECKVIFYNSMAMIKEKQISNIWTVDFEVNNRVSQSFLGKNMHLIYSQLLLGVKKLIDSVPVNGLKFYGADENQDYIYHQFYKRYLSKDFIQVNREVYVKKDFLRKIIPQYENPKNIYQSILGNYRDKLNQLKNIKNAKSRQRENIRFINKNINRVVRIDTDFNTGMYYLIEYKEGIVFCLGFNYQVVYSNNLSINSIISVENITPEQEEHYKEIIKKSRYANYVK